jgi:hypothetical protein
MKSAQEILKSREEKRQQKLKENQDQINKELLEFEKALNKYENDISDEKPYITVDEIIKTDEVKLLLKQNGYYIDKVSNDIKVNTTRVYLDESSYREAIKSNYKKPLNYSDYGVRVKPISNIQANKEEVKEKKTITEECMDLFELLQKIGQLHSRERSCY